MAVVCFSKKSERHTVVDVLDYLESHEVAELECQEILNDADVASLDDFLRQHMAQMNLTSLKLPKNGLTASSTYSLGHIVQTASTLRELDLSDNEIGNGLLALMEPLSGPSCRLTTLDLSNNRIESKSASALASLLRNNSTITRLSLAKNSLGPKSIKVIIGDLCDNTTLTALDLSHCKLGDRGITRLAVVLDPAVSKCPLQELNVALNSVSGAGAAQLAGAIVQNHNRILRRLDISDNRLGVEGAEAFRFVLQYSHTLEWLSLYGNHIESGVVELLQGIQESDGSNLQYLDLSWNSLKDEAGVKLAEILRGNSVLKHLNLAGNGIGSKGIVALAHALPADLALQELNIVGNQAEDDSAVALAQVICRPSCRLKTLKYDQNNKMSTIGIRRLESAFEYRENLLKWLGPILQEIEHRKIVSLNLTDKAMGDDEVIAISHSLAKSAPRVRTLWLSGRNISHRGITVLAKETLATNAVKMERLYLEHTLLGDAGMTAVAQGLVDNTSLRVLSLVDCSITSQGAKVLAQAMRRNETLARVNLRGNKIGDKGLQEILIALTEKPRPSLKALNVTNNEISDRGLFVQIPLAHLEELHLGKNQITDLGALDLAKACIYGQGIRWLNVAENYITCKGIQALKLFLPVHAVLESENQHVNNHSRYDYYPLP